MAPANKIRDIFNVNGLVAVITGGGSGLGLYAARALDANGAKAVYIVGRREQTLQDAAKTAVNGTIKPIVGDVTDKASLQKVADQVRNEQGYINLLFANAGVSGPKHTGALTKSDGSKPSIQEVQQKLFEPDMESFTQALHVNNTAVFYTAVAFLDLLDAGNKQRNVPQTSQIIVTSSVAGFSRHLAGSFAYSTSKAAATHLVKMLSTFLSVNSFNIRASVIAPGLYPSEMTEGQTSQLKSYQGVEGHENAYEGAHEMPHERSPAERTGSEEDFAGTILFMASRAGGYLNGETLLTDGGRLSQLPGTY
ncbi:Uu.00g061550.m01.CDS01 [Anthostomella pinea]|uniref:Uu.00g061550.m01.CDS01 n=1 Tax=Anthostomella pinea TaxID=933095 RepID=A0AAI8VLX1_9PEZI|nr:Uu.00g061550.m01.CDS01 [Anthostomella pinea]